MESLSSFFNNTWKNRFYFTSWIGGSTTFIFAYHFEEKNAYWVGSEAWKTRIANWGKNPRKLHIAKIHCAGKKSLTLHLNSWCIFFAKACSYQDGSAARRGAAQQIAARYGAVNAETYFTLFYSGI